MERQTQTGKLRRGSRSTRIPREPARCQTHETTVFLQTEAQTQFPWHPPQARGRHCTVVLWPRASSQKKDAGTKSPLEDAEVAGVFLVFGCGRPYWRRCRGTPWWAGNNDHEVRCYGCCDHEEDLAGHWIPPKVAEKEIQVRLRACDYEDLQEGMPKVDIRMLWVTTIFERYWVETSTLEPILPQFKVSLVSIHMGPTWIETVATRGRCGME